ncbi:MAG: DnaJ domain-containing protein [Cyanobacteria bacterium P01_F01_bin.86]
MNIEQGLFKLELTDYHAILGVSIEADAKQIRKRYLKIARKLHPDSLGSATDAQKQQASELLSKLVNPAYEKLTQEKEMAEHKVVLRLQGEQLSRRPVGLEIQTESAKTLLQTDDPLNLYNNTLKQLAEGQYESLNQVLEITGQISELNLAYLVRSGGKPAVTAQNNPTPTQGQSPATGASQAASPPPPSPKRQRESVIVSYLNRSREFAQKKEYSRAIIEMREAVRSHPNSAPCHSQLAGLYLQTGQQKMARIHLKRALDLDPNNTLAKQLEPRINQANQSKTDSKVSSSKSASSKSRGGLFGLFGGKDK